MKNLNLFKFTAVDGREVYVNYSNIDLIEDKGQTINVSFGGKWIELATTFEQFISTCTK